MKTFTVNSVTPYEVIVEKALLEHINDRVKSYYSGKKIAIIVDKNIDKYYAKDMQKRLSDYELKLIPVGYKNEKDAKLFNNIPKFYKAFFDFGLQKKDLVIAIGGGVVCDASAFAAATYLGGVNFIQIPASLSAQVDLAISTNIHIDTKESARSIRLPFSPRAVFVDTDLVHTISDIDFASGMATLIKYGCLGDYNLFGMIRSLYSRPKAEEFIQEIVQAACEVKANIVEQMVKDPSKEMLLSFGIPMARAIKNYFENKPIMYTKSHHEYTSNDGYSFGEAHLISMYYTAAYGEKIGVTEEGTADLLRKIAATQELPHKIFPEDKEKEFFEYLGKEWVGFVLLKEIGQPVVEIL